MVVVWVVFARKGAWSSDFCAYRLLDCICAVWWCSLCVLSCLRVSVGDVVSLWWMDLFLGGFLAEHVDRTRPPSGARIRHGMGESAYLRF
jgi:hypothetical protein